MLHLICSFKISPISKTYNLNSGLKHKNTNSNHVYNEIYQYKNANKQHATIVGLPQLTCFEFVFISIIFMSKEKNVLIFCVLPPPLDSKF